MLKNSILSPLSICQTSLNFQIFGYLYSSFPQPTMKASQDLLPTFFLLLFFFCYEVDHSNHSLSNLNGNCCVDKSISVTQGCLWSQALSNAVGNTWSANFLIIINLGMHTTDILPKGSICTSISSGTRARHHTASWCDWKTPIFTKNEHVLFYISYKNYR